MCKPKCNSHKETPVVKETLAASVAKGSVDPAIPFYWRGGDGLSLAARKLTPIDAGVFLRSTLQNTNADATWVGGVLSYEDLCSWAKLPGGSCGDLGVSRIYRLDDVVSPSLLPVSLEESLPPSFKANQSDDEYISLVERVRSEIQKGRYYQLNLLRYFDLDPQPSASWWWQRMLNWGGPYSMWLRDGEFHLCSLSPERFVKAFPHGDAIRLETYPIKGTASRSVDEALDARQREHLSNSEKDRAELSMIIDLMRNDFYRIAQPDSVMVEDPGSVHTFRNVHHLVGKVSALIPSSIAMFDVLQAIGPAGSITGAPKHEVTRAIREYEQRSRGFFMGLGFLWHPRSGWFDSSVLIRTGVGTSGKNYEFAVGSGIVWSSSAAMERDEVEAKLRVVSQPS